MDTADLSIYPQRAADISFSWIYFPAPTGIEIEGPIGGVQIGDHVMIGAGSVVLHDIASGLTVGGNPARPLHPEK